MSNWPTPDPAQVRQARLDLGLTQAQAGAMLGVDGRTWRRWEAGDRVMSPQHWRLWQLTVVNPNHPQ